MLPGSNGLAEFHPQTIIRDWGNGEAFRLADALTGVSVFGATGSGKSSGPAKHLAYGYLAAGFGGLVLCSKKEERPQWEAWAAETGRTEDLIIINAKGDWRFNFLDWEASRPGDGGGFAINTVALLDEIAGAIAGGSEGKGGGDQKFWEDALHNLNSNLVDLPLLAKLPVTLPLLREIASTAAQTPAEALSEHWQNNSVCARLLKEAEQITASADEQVLADFKECQTYWLRDFPALAEKTRSSIMLGFTVLLRPLITRPLRQLFSTDTNVQPEDTFNGKIIIVDLPVQEFRLAGRIANLTWKYCFQVAVLRRTQPPGHQKFLRPVFLWADEAQTFISRFDSTYQAVARSAGGCTVYLTQNRESFRQVLHDDDAVDALLGNLQAKFFCQNSGETNEWASKLLGQRWVKKTSTNVSRSRNLVTLQNPAEGGNNSAGVTQDEHLRNFVEASEFTTLRRGGPHFDYLVDAIIYNGGHTFAGPDGELLPYKRITFHQKK